MKILLVILAILSTTAFAQDSYHVIEKQTCSSDSCLIIGDSEIGFRSYINFEGYEISSLNTSASILDLDITISNSCFTGSNTEIENILKALAGNTDAQYVDGGHARIKSLAFAQSSSNMIVAKVFYKSDYAKELVVSYAVIKKCN